LAQLTGDCLITASNLCVEFCNKSESTAVVDQVSFSIAAGRTLALVGESGSGKTLTALSIIRVIPERFGVRFDGELMIEKTAIHQLPEKALRRVRGGTVGIIFQEPTTSLNPIMTVGKQIFETIRQHYSSSRRAAWERVDNLLSEVGLADIPDIRRRYPYELSGGQQQRVMIAVALSGDPKLLIADEPTTALDVTVQSQILDLLTNLQKTRGMAMLFISHDLGVISRIAHEIAIIRDGRIIEKGPAKTILRKPQEPYTQSLLACRPPLDRQRRRLPTLSDPGSTVSTERHSREKKQGVKEMILQLEDVSVSYAGRRWFAKPVVAVRKVSFDLQQGKTLGLVGESGSGKSSLAKAITGLIHLSEGRILFHGRELPLHTRFSSTLYKRIQYIFQDSYGALNPRHNVSQLISEPLDIHRVMRGSERRPFLERLVEEVGLEPMHLDRYPEELSGGQRQRVNIARALALSPELLICDEIVSALDVSIQARVLNLLKDIQEQRDLSLIFISHDLAVVRFMADHIAVMHQGKIVERNYARDIIESPNHPYTKELIAAVRNIEPNTDESLPIRSAVNFN
jgi:peptide/nickel transport system ATP-binding protein